MSIVSGLATAPGISSLLNARREINPSLRIVAGDFSVDGASNDGGSNRRPSGGAQSLRPITAPDEAEAAQTHIHRASSDPRYLQFVDAVTALRVDLSEVSLSNERIAELRKAAKEVFRMDGVPTDRQPDPVKATVKRPDPVSATVESNEARIENTQKTLERRRAVAEEADVERREKAEERNAEQLALRQFQAAVAADFTTTATPQYAFQAETLQADSLEQAQLVTEADQLQAESMPKDARPEQKALKGMGDMTQNFFKSEDKGDSSGADDKFFKSEDKGGSSGAIDNFFKNADKGGSSGAVDNFFKNTDKELVEGPKKPDGKDGASSATDNFFESAAKKADKGQTGTDFGFGGKANKLPPAARPGETKPAKD